MKTVKDLCEFLAGIYPLGATVVETGTMWQCAPGNDIHTTTNNFAKYLTNPGVLHSFDIDESHVDFAFAFVGDVGDVVYHIGDSVTNLKNWAASTSEGFVDILCLDSKEFDEDHMVNEFEAVKHKLNPEGHFVLADDIHNQNSVKWKKMVPILKDLSYSWIELPTPTGMFVSYMPGKKLPEGLL